jgi:hypothetical protein
MRAMRWVLIALAGCSTYTSPCSLGADEPVLTPHGAVTNLRRSASGIVVTAQGLTASPAGAQRSVTVTSLDTTGAMQSTQTFDAGTADLDPSTLDVEWTTSGLAIARALAMPTADFSSVVRSLEFEITGSLAPRTLPFADCTGCPQRTPTLRFLNGKLVLLYTGASTTDGLFAILGLDGSVQASGSMIGLTPHAPTRFKTDAHADALVLETADGVNIVDESLNVLAQLPMPSNGAIDFDRGRSVAQLAWIETESALASSLLTEQRTFAGDVVQPVTRITEAIVVTSVAATDARVVFSLVDDDRYLAAAGPSGQKLGGDLAAPGDTGPGDVFVATPDDPDFAYFTNAGATVNRRTVGCVP